MSTETPSPVAFVDQIKAAEILSVTPRCLEKWREQQRGPKFYRVSSRLVRYRICDLYKFMELTAVTPAATA